MFPMNRKPLPVTVEYDASKGLRARKPFPNMHAAKSFYVRKYREGRNPHIVSAKIVKEN